MRGTRWLLLVAIAAILVGVGLKYRELKHALGVDAPPKPNSLPSNLEAKSTFYHKVKRNNDKDPCARAEIWADAVSAERDSHQGSLTNVKIKLFNRACTAYDLVQSQAATYYENADRLFSEGPVSITINVPVAPDTKKPQRKPITVESSAVSFDTNTGRAETDKPTHFVFERGDGDAVGAMYDPTNRILELKSAVVVNSRPVGPHAKPMKIEAGNLIYREADSTVLLKPWGRMTREDTRMEGQNVVINLQTSGSGADAKHSIKQVRAEQAKGTEADTVHNRNLDYSADQLVVDYNSTGLVQAIGAQGNARMISTAKTSETAITGNHVEMAFNVDTSTKESKLSRVVAEGHGEVVEKPLPGPGRELGPTHILRSDNLEMRMRPGGQEIESVVTHSPGSLEFLPNLPTQNHRTLTGSRMTILYADQNRVQQFNVTDATTRTEPTADEKNHNRGVTETASRDLVAHMDPKTARLATLEQTGNFTFKENDRQASAAKATLDNDTILLDTKARMSDSSSNTTADTIRMDQHTGDFSAQGHVKSSRIAESDPGKTSEMLNGDDPLQAEADRMESHDRNHVFHYAGNVAMWQGANRITAQTIDINRNPDKKTLIADGHVVTTFYDQQKEKDQNGGSDTGKKGSKPPAKNSKNGQPAALKPPVKTVVSAPHLVYTDTDRLANYSGGVILDHAGTHVTSTTLHAFLADSNADSRLQNAVADGNVQIQWANPTRTRIGTSQHAEYYTSDQRVLMTGGPPVPKFVDSCKGSTQGEKLTYFANDDRLLVNGESSQPAQSRIDRSCK